jgi:NAD(P)H dehydrogenase (quinone)
MPELLISYYSRTGNTRQMAGAVAAGVRREKVGVKVKRVQDTSPADLLQADGIIIGSPTYYGGAAAPVRDLIDRSVKYHGRLEGKVGAAFASAGGNAGGAETTLLSILTALLVHGMVVQGSSREEHYGPVAIGAPNRQARASCERLGRRVARLVKARAAAWS